MNKKGKNKKGKVPNPVPVQEDKSGDKLEDVGKSDKVEDIAIPIGDKKEDIGLIGEVIQNIEQKVESDKEKRVPEIVSEIIPPAADVKDDEAPKKPKRNRGKKKKGKDDDFDDNMEEKSKETDNQVPTEETKVDIPEAENKPEELPLITPTARKKKNKKKNADQKGEELFTGETDQEPTNIPLKSEEKLPEVKDSVPEIKQEDLRTEIIEEVKPTKKKNKKKKRNDSEKSEEFSCTAAFQKILDDKDDPEVKVDEKVEDSNILLEKITGKIENVEIKTEKTDKTIPTPPPQEKAATPIKELEPIQEPPAAESKSKKKNKKDKKQPKVEEIPKQDEIKPDQAETLVNIETPTPSAIPLGPVEGGPVDIHKETVVVESPEPIVSDLSPKPKAKIAKPVEKKRKGKHESQTPEPPQDISILEASRDTESSVPAPLELLESKPVETENTSKVEIPTQLELTSDITLTAPDEDEKLIAQEFELLAEKAMGKKRKKGAKMPKSLDIAAGVQELKIESDIKAADVKDTTKEQLAVITEILTPQTDQQEFIIMSQKSDMPITVDNVKETVQEAPKPIEPPESKGKELFMPEFKGKELLMPEFKGKELLTPEKVDEELEFTKTEGAASQTEDKQKTDNKSGKKRKKSPKPPKKMEEVPKVDERPLTPTPVAKETSKAEDVTQQSLSEKIDASNITRMYDIEISSIKADESEGSACETVPDITYPRASSQQLRDDNNNTVIREIFPVEPVLGDIPVRQERVQTPVKQEEMRMSPKDEKTDIKSKMMEVNQDMEELRLSIERSLAELTSIEKSEENIEKEFETTRTKAKNVSDLLFDTGESAPKPTPIVEKETDKVLSPEGSASVPLERSKERSKSPMVSKNKQKAEGKHKMIPETTIPDQSKATSIPLPFVETIVAEAAISSENKTIEIPPKIEEKLIGFSPTEMLLGFDKPLIEEQKLKESSVPSIPQLPVEEKKTESLDSEKKVTEEPKEQITETATDVPPVCPARKDNKGKHKKKKGKQDSQATSATQSSTTATTSQTTQEAKKEEKTDSKSESKSDSKGKGQSSEKGKQQASNVDSETADDALADVDYEPIENFEDALTSSIDDVNKTFEMIVKESQEQNNPKINIIAPDEEKSPVSPPKNLLGHPDIPVRSNRRDFKKEKDKIPNEITARVKIKDSVEIERKQSKNTQTNDSKELSKDYKMDDNNDFVYKYSFRKVFLQSSCHVCKKSLSGVRVPCSYCNLLFYCSNKHKDEDWPQHQALCFAVSTIVHLKGKSSDQKFIYGDAKNLTGHDYRLIRMQMIVSCEKVLKRRLVPWEQEALLYPRVCAHVPCREWRQSKLSDCQGCGQISFCTENPDHFPKTHSRWCKSYSLYEKLVCYQQTKGRLEPKMPTKVLREPQMIPEKINEVLASMYEEKIDINDIQYAALTQLATAPLTAAYCHQLCRSKAGSIANGVNKKTSFTIHVVGAELQFEADALNKWEVFFLHLRADLQELRVVLINYNLNPSNLPLELLGKIKLCENCRQNKRRVVFSFQDKRTYADYKSSDDFVIPDIVCAFNPSIQRSSVYNGKDPWPSAINAILKLKVPFIITGYTITELHKDCIRIKECSETGYNFIAEPKYNNFASVRPDRNFISDDEMPLLFKNYCFAIISA
nr:titin isoform X1 [Helicoverpa armigera]